MEHLLQKLGSEWKLESVITASPEGCRDDMADKVTQNAECHDVSNIADVRATSLEPKAS